jgi:hypothetical protein
MERSTKIALGLSVLVATGVQAYRTYSALEKEFAPVAAVGRGIQKAKSGLFYVMQKLGEEELRQRRERASNSEE